MMGTCRRRAVLGAVALCAAVAAAGCSLPWKGKDDRFAKFDEYVPKNDRN